MTPNCPLAVASGPVTSPHAPTPRLSSFWMRRCTISSSAPSWMLPPACERSLTTVMVKPVVTSDVSMAALTGYMLLQMEIRMFYGNE